MRTGEGNAIETEAKEEGNAGLLPEDPSFFVTEVRQNEPCFASMSRLWSGVQREKRRKWVKIQSSEIIPAKSEILDTHFWYIMLRTMENESECAHMEVNYDDKFPY